MLDGLLFRVCGRVVPAAPRVSCARNRQTGCVRLFMRVKNWLRAHGKTHALVLSAGLAAAGSFTHAATPPNTPITNTASANYEVGATPLTTSGSVTTTTSASTPSTIEFLQYVPSGTAGTVEQVNIASCNASPLPAPTYILPPSTALTVPGALRLVAATHYSNGDPLFVRVTDFDHNQNATAIETISVTMTAPTGDTETLVIAETGVSTGIFIGYLQSTSAAVAAGDCLLSVSADQTITATYTDPLDVVPTVADTAQVDPFGVLFDSVSGIAVNGASVTLIDDLTNLPASVLCDDGVTALAQPVISGSPTACDTVMPPGGYRFPRVAPGNYRLAVAPAGGYVYPSSISPGALPPGFTIVGAPGSGASYGFSFALNPGPAVEIDIPLDASSGGLQIIKSAAKASIGIGEFMPYTLSIRNNSATTAFAVQIADRLPPGFRYQTGSTRLNGALLADPLISSDGRGLTFTTGDLASNATVSLRYVVTVTPGARPGAAENIARALSPNNSNTARASVQVTEDLFRDKAFLIGRVIVGSCDDKVENDLAGLENARVVLEDGRYVLTDREGRWHLDNITPGTHVVQLDLDSLPAGYEAVACEDNTRFAGRSFSQFVNVRGGTMWRADFHVRKRLPEAACPDRTAGGADCAPVQPIPAAPPAPVKQAKLSLVEELPYDDNWLAATTPGTEWLHPSADFYPALPAVKVAVKHDPRQRVIIKLNGTAVSPLNYDGAKRNADGTVALSLWRGVDLEEGANRLELLVLDERNAIVKRETRVIRYVSAPAKVQLVATQSRLVADGNTRPVIAVRFTDHDGHPVRRGLSGEFQINEPYQSQDRLDGIARDPLAGRINAAARYEITADGIALIELAPTTQSGEAVLSFQFGDGKPQEVRAWLTPGDRDWILVGFAEGTASHKKLSGNMESLTAADADERLNDGNRVALYAKGRIKGDYLLTMAYDSAKARGETGTGAALKQAIDPNRYYTLYADATTPQFDAQSVRKLYLKIEKNRFYALFGDYDTGLTVTELARYSRTLNGLKSEYQGELLGYSVFATDTEQAFIKDEIRGDGTSGLYRLSRTNILMNSDKLRIETRDRFHSENILNTRLLTRYLDYDIDYANGTVSFREPILSQDSGFNPVFIVAEYESADPADNKLTYGGRAAYRPRDGIEIGATRVHEGNVGATGDLTGVDATVHLDDSTQIKAEIAGTRRNAGGVPSDGDAWKLELTHDAAKVRGHLYARQQDAAFGLGQQNGSETGTRKIGADARRMVTDSIAVQGEIFRQDTMTTDSRRDVAEARIEKQSGPVTGHTGIRLARDKDGTGESLNSQQLIGGVAWNMPDGKTTLRTGAEVDFSGAESVDYPNRYTFGADYKLTRQATLFAEQEFARGDRIAADLTRIGLRTAPWSGGEMAASVGSNNNLDSERLFAGLGLTQKWQINERWRTDFGMDRSQTLKSEGVTPLNPVVPLASGNLSGDYTAAFTGLYYNNGVWSANSRAEWRNADTDDKRNLFAGVQRELDAGRSIAAGFSIYDSDTAAGARSTRADMRLAYASRPNDSRWVWLDRLDYITEHNRDASGALLARKLVNNLHANWVPVRQSQLSLQYGSKYVFDRIDNQDYAGYTDLFGIEARHDLNARWDIGVHASALHGWSAHVVDYGAGASVGYKAFDNAWLSVGYNLLGFDDDDFSDANYRAQGFYAAIRLKFDQDTLGLNRPGGLLTVKR